MNNIRVIHTGLNVSKILAQLKQYPDDWNTKMKGAETLQSDKWGFPKVDVGVLQLTIGTVQDEFQYVGDSETSINTEMYHKYSTMSSWLKRNGFRNHDRCGFLSLPVDGSVGLHVDVGDYYLTRDRYHLSIQGNYRYYVGDEYIDIEPGMLFWFNNKLEHGADNIGDCTRITFVVDLQHSKNNP